MFGRNATTLKLNLEGDPLRHLKDSDTLLCRDGSGVARDFIRLAGGGPYYHVAKFYTVGRSREPMVVEMVEEFGGRHLPWAEWYGLRDDTVDVFRPDPFRKHRYDRDGAIEWMLDNIVGQPYGKDVIRRFARQQNWLTCWWNRPCTDVDAPPPATWVCSTAAACADLYGGGCQPVHALWVGDVMPIQLARGNLYEYQLTIPSKVERIQLALSGVTL